MIHSRSFLGLAAALLLCPSVCTAQRLGSDELFARGVALYGQGKYAEAAATFAQVDRADSVAGVSARRRIYAPMWMAACYAQTGDTAKARLTSPAFYASTPIDRAKTVEIDSILDLMTDERLDRIYGAMGRLQRQMQGGSSLKGALLPGAGIGNVIKMQRELSQITANVKDQARLTGRAFSLAAALADESHPYHLYFIGQFALLQGRIQLVSGIKGNPKLGRDPLVRGTTALIGKKHLVKSSMKMTGMTQEELLQQSCMMIETLYLKEYLADHSYAELCWTPEDYQLFNQTFEGVANSILVELDLDSYSVIANETSLDYAKSLRHFARFYFYADNAKGLEKSCGKAMEVHSRFVTKAFSYLPAAERRKYWAQYEGWFQALVPEYAYYHPTDAMTAMTYDATLLSKGLLLNAENELQKAILASNDAQAKQLYEQLRQLQTQLGQQYELPKELRTANTDQMERESDELEKQLMARSAGFGHYAEKLSLKWSDVQKRLGKADVAIEFLRFNVRGDSTVYAALSLRKGYKAPHLTLLATKQQMEDGANDAQRLYALVWQPLQAELQGAERVYFAPAGVLYQKGVEYLPTPSGELFSSRYDTYRLSSTRELALRRTAMPQPSATALFGGIDYKAGATADGALNGGNDDASDVADASADAERVSRSLRSLVAGRGAKRGIDYLKGTKVEIDSIAALLPDAQVFTGTQGTESALKRLSASPLGVLHISTHGFSFSPKASDAPVNFAFLLPKTDRASAEDQAMSLTGLLLAGAERQLFADRRESADDDGILTAREISNLDFHDLGPVVLSACETGLGEITGDGVFGLQRGFKKAGAQTIVMSLWQVDDEATQLLMTEFYRNMVVRGQTKRQAFANAQQHLRQYADGRYDNPNYWAAFILLDGLD